MDKTNAFNSAVFIKSDAPKEGSEACAPLFRKSFALEKAPKADEKAILSVCGLGVGFYYINGIPVSDDLFAPQSDYLKTLWYLEYDVTRLLRQGENIFAAMLGNGWYNETFETVWEFHKAPWRDTPKLIAQLNVAGRTVLATDGSFQVSLFSPVVYNQLRSGEHYDARRERPDWNLNMKDGTDWKNAVVDQNPPTGVFRKCPCEPIREDTVYPGKRIFQTGPKKYVYDIGQNISGYIRLKVDGTEGSRLTVRYAETIDASGALALNRMDTFYPHSAFQTDVYCCAGKKAVWSPHFAYHGFRYLEIDGIDDPEKVEVAGVFVHQAVEKRTTFCCSDPFLNELFRAGQISSYSNMFYALTDCPTREKLGWANDAQASAEQMLTNFKTENLFRKWMTDIRDAMREDGSMPGVIPTSGWGYEWGNGPVSDGLLFELGYRVYLHTGDGTLLKDNLPYFKKYLSYLASKEEDGKINFGLNDWASPGMKSELPASFVNAVLRIGFLRIAALSAKLCGAHDDEISFRNEEERQRRAVTEAYLDRDGACIYDEQTAVAMMIYEDLYGAQGLAPLKNQLAALIERADFHHNCGMVGLRRLYLALNKCGLEEYAYRIITAKGYPSYAFWFEHGATALWEMWEDQDSRNHHMYSDFMSWMIKTILGISLDESRPGTLTFNLRPYFFRALRFARGEYESAAGKIAVEWERKLGGVALKVRLDDEMKIYFDGKRLPKGTTELFIAE